MSSDFGSRDGWSWVMHGSTLRIGRTLFAVAMAGFGVLCLAYLDFVHQLQPVAEFLPASTRGYVFLAALTGVALIAASLAIVTGVKAFLYATALTALFALWIIFLQVPSAFLNPQLLRSPWWVRTFETLALTGGALVLAGLTSGPERRRWIRGGCVLFGVSLPVFGILHFIYAENVASLIPGWYPWPLFLAYLTGMGNVAAGVAIASGMVSRLAAILIGLMYALYALTLHIPRAVSEYLPQLFMDDPTALQRARGGLTSLFVAIAMWGVAWIVAGSSAPPAPSVPPNEETPLLRGK
ncbi:MAG: hypothetical protein ACRD5G_02115 [Candidatus Acidiferrales bacterium]